MGFKSSTAIAPTQQAPALRLQRSTSGLRCAAIIGNFPPRQCGIATFTRDTFESLRAALPGVDWKVVAMEDSDSAHAYGDTVTHVVPQDDLTAYVKTADDLNRSGVEVAFLQHEFGIFGGESGGHVLAMLRRLRMPVVSTLHTVLERPTSQQKEVLDEIIRLSANVIVMTETGADIIERVHGVGPRKVHVIPHGAPERPFSLTEPFKEPLGLSRRKLIMTFGLLSPNKGIETIIRGLPAILERHPDMVYLIAGATHPHLVAREGESYRESLVTLAKSLGVADSLRFVNRYLGDDELVDLLQAADLYVTPYLTEAQVTSGTLAYAIAVGKPVISTPYWHAVEALADGIGVICPFNDTRAFTREITTLLSDDARREAMARQAYRAGEPSRWRRVASETIALARVAISMHEKRVEEAFRTLARPKFGAVTRMSDDCGIFQHSRFGAPDRHHGYCTDDTARTLALTARLAREGAPDDAVVRSAVTSAAFVNHAWNPKAGRFRNFMGYDRQWRDDGGSDDCCARALEALCLFAREWPERDLADWAADLAREAMQHVGKWSSLRAHALIIKAILAAEGRVIEADEAARLIAAPASALMEAMVTGRNEGHLWFEPCFAYDNARLPEALILAGERLEDAEMLGAGLDALERLMKLQTSQEGWFMPVATSIFAECDARHVHFDQQPIEALATIEACFVAWRVTGDTRHCADARMAFDWFGGRNAHGLALARPEDGVCADALTIAGVNRNHGAESILSYQLAAVSIREFLLRLPPSTSSLWMAPWRSATP
ncbi:MAG: glycosyltransferase family 4 protein [Hyphomonadaceae bacterium]